MPETHRTKSASPGEQPKGTAAQRQAAVEALRERVARTTQLRPGWLHCVRESDQYSEALFDGMRQQTLAPHRHDEYVAANIARFDDGATSEAILQAARVAGAHEMILRLPDGYDTRMGERGTSLSAGQRQRIGLARAVYGQPFLIVLDEPNANLDAEGENALVSAIETLRKAQSIVVVVSHRSNALAALNQTMVIYEGRLIAFGPSEEVFARVARPTAPAAGAPKQSKPSYLTAGAAR